MVRGCEIRAASVHERVVAELLVLTVVFDFELVWDTFAGSGSPAMAGEVDVEATAVFAKSEVLEDTQVEAAGLIAPVAAVAVSAVFALAEVALVASAVAAAVVAEVLASSQYLAYPSNLDFAYQYPAQVV